MHALGHPSPSELLLVEGRQTENVDPSVLEGLVEFDVTSPSSYTPCPHCHWTPFS